jgi:O-antigen/teichoic acid export membrane protein
MLGFGGHAALLNVGNMLAFGTGNSVAGMTSGASAASTFYTSQMPAMMAYNLLGRLNESTTPALNELYGRGDFDRVRLSFSRITRLQLFFGFPLAMGVLLFNRDLVSAWVGPQQYAGTLMTVALSIYCVVSGVLGIAMRFSYVFGWMRLLATTSILQGFANFGVGLYLGRTLGLGGISLALVIVVMPQFVILLRKIGNSLRLNVVRLLAGCTVRAIVPLMAASAVGLIAHSFVRIRIHHFGGFLLEAFPFLVVYFALAYFIYFVDQDRQDTRRFLAGAIDRARGAGIRLGRAIGVN